MDCFLCSPIQLVLPSQYLPPVCSLAQASFRLCPACLCITLPVFKLIGHPWGEMVREGYEHSGCQGSYDVRRGASKSKASLVLAEISLQEGSGCLPRGSLCDFNPECQWGLPFSLQGCSASITCMCRIWSVGSDLVIISLLCLIFQELLHSRIPTCYFKSNRCIISSPFLISQVAV